MTDLKIVGKDVQRIDVREKATGKAKYALDLTFPGMLIGKILRSPYPHAKIVNINVSKAERLKGVEAVLYRDNASKVQWGDYLTDQTVVAIDKARFIGDPVAAVAALDADTAEEALNLIEVDYEELEPVFDPEKAMEAGAPILHEKLEEYEHPPVFHPVAGSNICNHVKLRKGDVDKGFKQAYRIYENRFTMPPVHHCYMEPQVVIGDIDSSGRIILHGSLQSPFGSREGLARVFQIPQHRIRVIVNYIGGGFGGKSTMVLEPITASLAVKASKPVKVILTREEDFVSAIVRHPLTSYIKVGVDKEGRLLAVKQKLIWDTGAYSDDGVAVSSFSGLSAAGPYDIPNLWVDSYCVYTNAPVAGAFRGFGISQVTWGMESQIDVIAKDLGLDSLELRLKNAFEEGSVSATGEKLHSVGIKESLQKAADAIDWGQKRPAGRGVGIASMFKFTAPLFPSAAIVKVNDDGNVEVFKGAVELGQGINTIMCQIAAEVLGITTDNITTAAIDTEFTPYDWKTVSSRSTFFSGNAVRRASEDARRQLIALASKKLEVSPDSLVCRDGRVFVNNEPENGESFKALANYSNFSTMGPIVGKGGFGLHDIDHINPDTGQSKRLSAYWMYGTQAAEVEVDKETGEVKIFKLTAAHDLGKAINPFNCEQQIEGSLATGVGTTLYEELVLDSGKAANASFVDYKIPRAKDIPIFIPLIVEAAHREGPFGAKGLGEPGLAPTAPAISNAIYDATGVRIKDLPITPEKILKALKEKSDTGDNTGEN